MRLRISWAKKKLLEVILTFSMRRAVENLLNHLRVFHLNQYLGIENTFRNLNSIPLLFLGTASCVVAPNHNLRFSWWLLQ